MAEMVIKAQGLGCQTGRQYLLKDINWEVQQGQHWVIFGMNGCGKTTLLSMVAGFKKQTHGKLEVLGQQYRASQVLNLRKRIGWVSSSFFDKYYTKESALQIVLSGLSGTFGIEGEITDAQVIQAKELLYHFNLGERIDYPFSFMSKGERQTVLIARALIGEPEILVLDEPGTGLDVLARETMLHIVQKLAENKKITILYVTHYIDEILTLFQNCLLLKNGRVYAKGMTTELLTSQQLSVFLEYPVTIIRQENRLHMRLANQSEEKALLQGQGWSL